MASTMDFSIFSIYIMRVECVGRHGNSCPLKCVHTLQFGMLSGLAQVLEGVEFDCGNSGSRNMLDSHVETTACEVVCKTIYFWSREAFARFRYISSNGETGKVWMACQFAQIPFWTFWWSCQEKQLDNILPERLHCGRECEGFEGCLIALCGVEMRWAFQHVKVEYFQKHNGMKCRLMPEYMWRFVVHTTPTFVHVLRKAGKEFVEVLEEKFLFFEFFKRIFVMGAFTSFQHFLRHWEI